MTLRLVNIVYRLQAYLAYRTKVPYYPIYPLQKFAGLRLVGSWKLVFSSTFIFMLK